MATSLKTRKGVLTRHTNTLSQFLTQYAHFGDDAVVTDQTSSGELLNQIQMVEIQIRTTRNAFEKALYAFTETVDSLENPLTEEEEKIISEYINKSQEIISETENLLTKMEVNKQCLSFHGRIHSQVTRTTPENTLGGNLMARAELPKIPIPEFSGKTWQWDNFWELFNATVHSLSISDLQKFNYLLRALKGEARESVVRFQVTSSNYSLAISHLQQKDGNVQTIVTSLHKQLEQWSARSSALKDQRKLLDQLCIITTQLEKKGEPLDSPWLLSKILYRFTETIQRGILREKVSPPPGESWTFKKLMTTLDVVIK
ncbi:hypothetical protein ANCCEY_04321 [Ancylostoma ceylanicum]|uniref:Uncharacterized protein n=1 Tax=Ancylostoma ceylanicum TaxID=53326 RepID=A0A0D6M9S8_9BILA|nr:hypothetical protein ANCCEY_04321 [Ancylostoma ceylanicum]